MSSDNIQNPYSPRISGILETFGLNIIEELSKKPKKVRHRRNAEKKRRLMRLTFYSATGCSFVDRTRPWIQFTGGPMRMFELLKTYRVGNRWISIMRLPLPHLRQHNLIFARQAFHHDPSLAFSIEKEAQTQQKQHAQWHTNAYPNGSGILRSGMS